MPSCTGLEVEHPFGWYVKSQEYGNNLITVSYLTVDWSKVTRI